MLRLNMLLHHYRQMLLLMYYRHFYLYILARLNKSFYGFIFFSFRAITLFGHEEKHLAKKFLLMTLPNSW